MPVSYTHLDVYKRQGVEYPDEEIVDEGTCPIDPEPGDCGGGVDYGGCEDPVIDEGSHINITLRNGAFWDVTGDSTLTTLDNDSFVTVSYTHLDVYKRQ